MNYLNPAERLLNILTIGRTKSTSQKCLDVWHEILEIPGTDIPLAMIRLGKVMALPVQIISALNDIPNIDIKTYLHWRKPVLNAFAAQNLNGQWNSFLGHLDEHAFNYLEMTSNILSHHLSDIEIDDAELSDIYNQAAEIYTETENSDLPLHIKQTLLKQITKLQSSIEEVNIFGLEPLIEVVEGSIGKYATNPDFRDSSKTVPGKNLWKMLVKISIILSLFDNGASLLESISAFFPQIEEVQITTPQNDTIIDVDNINDDITVKT